MVVYGAGHAGKTVARVVAASGLPVVLAGRDLRRVKVVASNVGVPFAIASTTIPSELDGLLGDAMAVVNTAGPLAATAPSLIDAAIRNGTHYLDIANEPEVLAAAFRSDSLARERGVSVVVGLGLGVAVSEAAAVEALSLLPEAQRLEVVFAPRGLGSPTVGVVRTMLQTLAHGPYAVADGRLVRHNPGWGVRPGYLGRDAVPTSLIPVFTGDLLALSRSQPVGDVIVYTPVRLPTMSTRVAVPAASALLRSQLVRQVAARAVNAGRHGRIDTKAARPSFVTVTAINRGSARAADATLVVPDTPELISRLVARVIAMLSDGLSSPGVWTPCQALGPRALLNLVRG